MTEFPTAQTVVRAYDETPFDRKSMPQEKLNLDTKSRTSLFPWRGQFSPELIESLLMVYAKNGDTVLDPFAGSGTVLFEAARRGMECYAAEINPSAATMASTSHFVNVKMVDRSAFIETARSLVEALPSPSRLDLFSTQQPQSPIELTPIEELVGKLIQDASCDALIKNILGNALIRYMRSRNKEGSNGYLRALNEHSTIVMGLPYSEKRVQLFHTDARTIPLDGGLVDLIITSPPYINVFNYHQNDRPAMELMGWNLLQTAHSEFGSNRKNRQNRFLTVVQYCLDMLDLLHEMRRLLKPDGRAILIVGRESSVRGVRFGNSRLVAALASGAAGFKLRLLQERVFTNRFGERIYEDILHLQPDADAPVQSDTFAQSLAQLVLSESSLLAEGDIQEEILAARDKISQVRKSPIFELSAHSSVGEEFPNRCKTTRTDMEVKSDAEPDTAPRKTEGATYQLQAAADGQTAG